MSRKVKTLVNKKSKYYLGSGLPKDTDLQLSNFDKKYLDFSLTKIEYDLCFGIIQDWIDVYNKTGFRCGRFYPINKRLYFDLGLSCSKHKDDRYKIYIHFKENK